MDITKKIIHSTDMNNCKNVYLNHITITLSDWNAYQIEDVIAWELKDPIWHSLEWQIGSISSQATMCLTDVIHNWEWLKIINP